MVTRQTHTEHGKFFIHADNQLRLNNGEISAAAFLDKLIRKDYKKLIRPDYDVEVIERLHADISVDDSFITQATKLAETFPKMKNKGPRHKDKKEQGDQKGAKTIHLIVAAEDTNPNPDSEALGSVNKTHLDLDHAVQSINTPTTPGIYTVLINDQPENHELINFAPAKSPAIPLALRAPGYGIEGTKTLNTPSFKTLPRITTMDPPELLRLNFKALVYQILYDQDLFKDELKINDLPAVDRQRLKQVFESPRGQAIEVKPVVKERMEKFLEKSPVQVDQNFFAYMSQLINF